ncbi:MAG: hypothetical protein ACKVQA_21135, partial [Burkholderiales bacterium]
MKLLALSPAVAFALLSAVALLILALHLLKPPPPRAMVSSLVLWAKVARARKRPAARWVMSLILALMAGLSLAFALAHPEIPALGASARRLALVLDNSPSMAAKASDGRTRWEHALQQARALVEHAGPLAKVRIMDLGGLLGEFADQDAALSALSKMATAPWRDTSTSPTLSAMALEVHFFTDGVAPVALPNGAMVHSVFERADNVAVTAFEASPLVQDPTRYEALVQVLNASPGKQRVRVLIAGDGDFSIAQELDLGAGETVNATFDISGFKGGVLGASVLSPTDAFDRDDLAYVVVPPHALKRVLLVTPGNPALEDALRSVPGTRLSVTGPAGYSGAGSHDAVVFDRFAPTAAPSAGALLFRPTPRAWLAAPSAILERPRITAWEETHAVTRGIAWRNLRLARASLNAVSGDSIALVTVGGPLSGALVSAGESPARWVRAGFALEDSNFALQPGFPVFLGNALSWVTDPAPVLKRALGSVEVPFPGSQVHDGSGQPVSVAPTASGVAFEAQRPDVYTVSAPGKRMLVVTHLPDPGYALINDTH